MNPQSTHNKVQRYRSLFLFVTLALLFGLLTPLGATPALAQATVVKQQVDFPIDMTDFLECTGEEVHLTGAVHRQSHTIIDNNGGVHFQSVNNDFDLSGVGLTSGLAYHRTGATIISYHIQDAAPQEFTSVDVLHFIRQSSGPVLELRVTVHMTLNANGEITTTFENIHFACGS